MSGLLKKKGSDDTAGTRIQYWLAGRHSGYMGDHVVADGSHEVPTIDVEEYQRLLEKAVLEVLDPFMKRSKNGKKCQKKK